MYRICSRRLLQMKVLEVLLSYKRSYLWSLKNLACSDSTESDGVVKDWISMFHGVTLRKRGERGCGPF